MEKVIILGTGVAGCTAAIYTARANLSPLLISGPEDGGQLTLTTEVENFPGFPEGVEGTELVNRCKKQAERFGAKFKTDIVTKFQEIDDGFELTLVSGEKLQCHSLIVATGASARWLGLESEEKYKGRGVSTCATCDGAFYKNKEVVVIGGGDSAMEEALFLTKFATKVTVVHRRDTLRASKIMQERATNHEKISFIWDSEISEVVGDKFVTGVKLKNLKTNEITDFKCDGVFLAIGHIPNTKPFIGKLELDEQGYLKADRFMHTNIPGVFAAGDVHDTKYRQAITAAGMGCQAAIEVERYLTHKGIE
ncbi:thioredoxin-disulfide reductase [Candidatus Woesearchaeota archaeon CG10_big_fil_rev_8_21_14_0_10_45_16]|nr:MAG: thioredoxin-disulfide reductase [Candidatus Woesearchaeota archaeon CG10_big_fil_rev_8_21_14_0_10_45_16]